MNADSSMSAIFHDLNDKSISALLPLFQMLFNESLDNVGIYTASGETVYINPTLFKTLNITDSTEIADDQSVKESFTQYKAALQTVLQTGEAKEFLIKVIHPKFSRVIYDLIYMSVIRDDKNTIIGVLATGRDLNFYEQEKKQEIIKQEHYLRALLDTFPFIVWMKDRQMT